MPEKRDGGSQKWEGAAGSGRLNGEGAGMGPLEKSSFNAAVGSRSQMLKRCRLSEWEVGAEK